MPPEHDDGPRRALLRLAEHPDTAGVLTDYDGTLSAIVGDPEAARPLRGAVDVLHQLAERVSVVAVVSGRPAHFLVEHLGLDGAGSKLRASGLYGLERVSPGGEIQVRGGADRWQDAVDQALGSARRSAPAGVAVEDKGLAVTFHWRRAPERADWCRRTAQSLGARFGLAVHPAKMSIELRPPIAADKGTVVSELATGLEAVCYLGDDVGDLPAFEALDRLASLGVSTCKVVAAGREVPDEVVAAADLTVPGPSGAVALLARLAKGEEP